MAYKKGCDSRTTGTSGPGAASRGERRVCIVIADDHPLVLNEVANFLEPHYDVVARAANGRELVNAVAQHSPDLVVADVAMPEMNGIDATREITSEHPNIKVVLLSGYDDPALVEAAFQAGASAYVSKMHAATELLPAIEKALANRQ
jgi:DNA-binding NarL/FixJ family response regulator